MKALRFQCRGLWCRWVQSLVRELGHHWLCGLARNFLKGGGAWGWGFHLWKKKEEISCCKKILLDKVPQETPLLRPTSLLLLSFIIVVLQEKAGETAAVESWAVRRKEMNQASAFFSCWSLEHNPRWGEPCGGEEWVKGWWKPYFLWAMQPWGAGVIHVEEERRIQLKPFWLLGNTADFLGYLLK